MNPQDYTTNITVNAAPQNAFKAINSVSDWWTKIFEGSSEKVDDVFTVRFGETFITVRIEALVSEKKILWHVIDCNKHWLKDKKEWKDTKIAWEILPEGNQTKINFTHTGLLPRMECYNACEKAWDSYIGSSLYKLLEEGKGMPELK